MLGYKIDDEIKVSLKLASKTDVKTSVLMGCLLELQKQFNGCFILSYKDLQKVSMLSKRAILEGLGNLQMLGLISLHDGVDKFKPYLNVNTEQYKLLERGDTNA